MIYNIKENCQCGATFSYEEQLGNGMNDHLKSKLDSRYREFLNAHAICRNKPNIMSSSRLTVDPLLNKRIEALEKSKC